MTHEDKYALIVQLRERIAELEMAKDNYKQMVVEQKQRIAELEKALETIADEYQYQVGFDEYYENAMDVFYGRGEA